MGIESFIPQIWSGSLQTRLHKSLVFGAVANRNYQGEVVSGDRVQIDMINAMNATAYVPNSTTVSVAQLDGAPIFLDIDRKYYSAFYLEDLDKRQAVGDVMGEATQEMSYTLANEMDTYIGTLYTQAQIVSGLGTSGSPIDLTSLNVTEYFSLVAQKMDENNVPQEGRYIVVAPWVWHKIELADITLNTANSGTLVNGFKNNYLGFNIYVSNNVSIGTASTNADTRMIAGYPGSITLAQQIAAVDAYRDQVTGFRDVVRALNVYGAKVVRPNATACFRADYTAEP